MTFGTGIILDIIFLVVIVLAIRSSARRGFVRTVVELVGWLILIYVAFRFSQPLAESFYDSFLHKPVSESILHSVQESLSDTAVQTSTNLWENLPGYVRVGFDMAQGGLQSTVDSTIGGGAELITNTLMQSVVTPMLIMILRWVIIALIFGVGMLVVRAVAKSLNKLFSLPLIGSLNRTLGGVIGAVKGLIIVLVLCILLSVLFTLVPEGIGPVNLEMLKSSYTYRLMDGFNVFTFQYKSF